MITVESTNNKRLKLNDDDDDDEDEIDLSKGEDRERYIINKEGKLGTYTKNKKIIFLKNFCYIIVSEKKNQKLLPIDNKNLLSYRKISTHFLNDYIKDEHNNLKMTAADYHKKVKILVTGFSNGSFLIFETVGKSLIHSLKLV